MTTKERIKQEIDRVDKEDLEVLYEVVKRFASPRADGGDTPTLLSRLKRIQIDAPEDFASHLDAYTSGEKRVR